MTDSVRVERHDRLQLELKTSYTSSKALEKRKAFALDMWFFVPESMGIRPENYDAKRFYEDLKGYVRHQTPAISLEGLASDENQDSPLQQIQTLLNTLNTEGTQQREQNLRKLRRESKLLCCIFRKTMTELKTVISSHLNDSPIHQEKGLALLKSMLDNAKTTLETFRAQRTAMIAIAPGPKTTECFDFADEALSTQVDASLLPILRDLKKIKSKGERSTWTGHIQQFIEAEQHYREAHGYLKSALSITEDSGETESLWNQLSLLKKFTSSVLYLQSSRNHFVDRVQDVLLGVAAALAMIWAVGVQALALLAFDVQLAPNVGDQVIFLFLAMAVSAYVLKDRIKSWVGQGLSKRIPEWLYDRRFDLSTEDETIPVGTLTETVRFVDQAQLPNEIRLIRESQVKNSLHLRVPYRILHYRRRVEMNLVKAAKDLPRMQGFSDIMRINVWRWVRTLDTTSKSILYRNEAGDVDRKTLANTYGVDLIVRSEKEGRQYQPKLAYHRVVLNRRGIVRVE